jgi:two-component system sensor histidine kinase KdpD
MPLASTRWRQWVLWLAALLATTALLLALRGRLDKAHVSLVYLLVVLGASAAGGRAIGLSVAGLAFLAFNFLFLPPYYTFIIADPLDWLVLIAFLATGVVATQLLAKARQTADVALARAEEVDRLATLGAETLAAPNAEAALQAIAEVIRTAVGADAVELYRRDEVGELHRTTNASGRTDDLAQVPLTTWFAERVHAAVTLPDGTTRLDPPSLVGIELRAIHRTLDVREHTVGVLRVVFAGSTILSTDRARLLDALAYYAALGVERVRLEVTAERAEAERRVESLRSALLMSVSHDLRTPLTTIKALAHEIAEATPLSAAGTIESEADRLDAMVGDLLDLSRIQAGAVHPTATANTVDELIGAALQRARGALKGRDVHVTLPEAMLVALFDLTPTLRILVNLLENAVKYTPDGTRIEISAQRDGAWVRIDVADEGPGIPAREVEHVFEPFYRHLPPGTSPDVRGAGLGLSIARGLAEAQGGTLRYRTRVGSGSVFELTLPAADDPLL